MIFNRNIDNYREIGIKAGSTQSRILFKTRFEWRYVMKSELQV